MKLLLQVSGVDATESDINYATIEIDDEVKQYLAKRQSLFVTAQQFAEDLMDLRFVACSFITFYNNIDLDFVMGKGEQKEFEGQGYWKIPDDLPTESSVLAEQIQSETLILDDESFYIIAFDGMANDEDGSDVMTREVPFVLLGLQ